MFSTLYPASYVPLNLAKLEQKEILIIQNYNFQARKVKKVLSGNRTRDLIHPKDESYH